MMSDRKGLTMTRRWIGAFAAATLGAVFCTASVTNSAWADVPKVTLAMSGWTGFAPITLAQKAGIFERNGVEVEIKKMPTSNRHQAMASGDVQAITTTVDTHILYASSGVPVTQVLVLDTSAGGDGIAARDGIGSLKELKGKSVAVQFGGVPQFWLAYLLKQEGMKLDDVKLTNLEPKDAANAFVAGQFDAAVTYEPYLSTVRTNNAGKIIVTSADTPGVIVDTLAFQPDYIAKNPAVVQAMVKSWFEALDMIKATAGSDLQDHGRRCEPDAGAVPGLGQVREVVRPGYEPHLYGRDAAEVPEGSQRGDGGSEAGAAAGGCFDHGRCVVRQVSGYCWFHG